MKKDTKVAIILILMFLFVQLLGLYIITFYIDSQTPLPYGFNQQPLEKTAFSYGYLLFSFLLSFVIAIALILFLVKTKSRWIMKVWFFAVVTLGIGITLNVFLKQLNILNSSFIALLLGLGISYFKIFKRNILMHNLTELLVYPGIGAVFALMFNIWVAIIVMILYSIYDMWAVWKSGFMLKLAKYQMNTIGVLGGIMIPYADKKIKEKIKLLKLKFKDKKIPESVLKRHGIKVHLAILGGGDLFFPLIASGAFYNATHNLLATLIVTFFAVLALIYLFAIKKKNKAYPALPYLTVGLFIGMFLAWLLMHFSLI